MKFLAGLLVALAFSGCNNKANTSLSSEKANVVDTTGFRKINCVALRHIGSQLIEQLNNTGIDIDSRTTTHRDFALLGPHDLKINFAPSVDSQKILVTLEITKRNGPRLATWEATFDDADKIPSNFSLKADSESQDEGYFSLICSRI